MAEQNYANHVRWVPTFHFFVMPVLIVNLLWSIYRLFRPGFTWDSLIHALTAAALVTLMFNARIFVLTVQDRVIRMEERQRMNRILPEDLKVRIGEFTVGQLVALRFASDDELPGLARRVLTDKASDRNAIKQMVQNWRPDHLRA